MSSPNEFSCCVHQCGKCLAAVCKRFVYVGGCEGSIEEERHESFQGIKTFATSTYVVQHTSPGASCLVGRSLGRVYL